MLKRILIFLLFLGAAFFSYARGKELTLAYYTIFPMTFFPIFYFFDARANYFFAPVLLIFLTVFVLFWYGQRTLEATLMGAGHLALFGMLSLYRRQWEVSLIRTTSRNETAFKELQLLEQRHNNRLESLRHLEKQVSSLMNLFEIARDFSECLSFGSLASMIQKKVMQELPSEKLHLIEMPKDGSVGKPPRVITITASGIEENEVKFRPDDVEIFKKVSQSGKMLKAARVWIFPVYTTAEVVDLVRVDGADPDDFAKFEVLVSHLTLQVKKIRLYEAVRELSIIDGLTGIFVRRHFLDRFEEELKRSIKYGHPLAVFMLDIDHFKRYNDDFGHLVGDATLKEVASILQANLRRVDIVGRYGGEEFIIVIPETQREGALEVAERIRSGIARRTFKTYDEETRVTVSIGIALFPADVPAVMAARYEEGLAAELIQRSDQALYKAKEEGRNRVVLYQEL